MTLELTTSFRGISTAGGKSAGSAAGLAATHLRYIDRESAVEDRASSGFADLPPEQQRDALRQRFRDRSEKGGKNGARVAERFIVSLPNSWPREARQDALQRLCEHIAPPDSDAVAYGVTHRDKPGNAHLHILAQDGAESHAAALLRRPDAKRVRRKNVIRLGHKSRAKEMRGEIASILNDVAAERGIEGVEWRSFEDRGITRHPTRHEGPTRRAQAAREQVAREQAEAAQKAKEGREWLDSKIAEEANFLASLPPLSDASQSRIEPIAAEPPTAPSPAIEGPAPSPRAITPQPPSQRAQEAAEKAKKEEDRARRVREAAEARKVRADEVKARRVAKRLNANPKGDD